jgi:hypothetical protein
MIGEDGSDAFSAIMIVAAFVLADTRVGVTEASTTRNPATPRSRLIVAAVAKTVVPVEIVRTARRCAPGEIRGASAEDPARRRKTLRATISMPSEAWKAYHSWPSPGVIGGR